MKRLLFVLSVVLFLPCIAFAGKGGGTTQPTAPWPMFGNNPQHTGQSSYSGPSAGTVNWAFYTGMGGFSNSVVIGQDGTVYVAGHIYNTVTLVSDDFLAAYNPDSTLKWQTPLHNNTTSSYDSTPAISSTGTIYVTSYSRTPSTRYLHAVSPSGEILWQTLLGGTPLGVSIITVGKDGTIYVPGPELTAVNPDGSIKWTYYCNTNCSSIAMSPKGDAIYTVETLGSYSYPSLLALNTSGGSLWELPVGNDRYFIRYHNPIAVAGDGTIYLQSAWDNIAYLYAVTPSGTVKWSFKLDGSDRGVELVPSVSKNGNIYFLIGDSSANTAKLYKLDGRGRLKWVNTINGNCQNNGPAIDANENIYIGSYDGAVYSFTSNGVERWKVVPHNNAKYFWGNSPALGSDGRLYINGTGSDGIYLYSIGQ